MLVGIRQKFETEKMLFMAMMLVLCMVIPVQAYAKEVRVGYYENDNFQAGASDDLVKTGYSYEYMRRLQAYTDWEYEYVYGEYGDLYDMLLSGDIDILTGLAYREERASLIGFPELAMGDTPYTFLKRSEETDITSDPKTIEGKTIGVVDGAMKSVTENYLKENNVKAKLILYNDVKARDKGLVDKEVDITIVEGNGTGTEEGIEAFAEAGATDYFVCTNIKRPDILEDLNKAQAEMFEASPQLKSDLNSKWFRVNAANSTLTSAEQAWRKTHPTLTVGYINNFRPYSHTDENGNTIGIVKDVTEEIFRSLGITDLKIVYKGFDTCDEMCDAVRNGDVDAAFPILGNYWTSEQQGLMPSDSVYASYFDLIYKGEYPDLADMTLAVPKGKNFYIGFAKIALPDAQLIECDSVEACLDAVVDGTADAAIINGLQSEHYLRLKDEYKEMITAQLAADAPVSYATLSTEHVTRDILNHGIALMDPDFALVHTYQYQEKYEITAFEFIKQNIWLPALILVAFAGLVTLFLATELAKDKKYLAAEAKQKAAKAAEEAIVQSIVSLYFCALEIDVKTGKIRVIRIPEFMKSRFEVDGYTFAEIEPKFIEMCVDPAYHEEVHEFMDFDTLLDRLESQKYLSKNYIGRTEGWLRCIFTPVHDSESGEITKLVFAVANINDEKKREERIRYQAEHDELTGVLNRKAFTRLENELLENENEMALMIMDIDKFKSVNDTYGHDVGDLVIKQVADILTSSFRRMDHVVRYGGDEFVVIFPECGDGFLERIEKKIHNINEVLLHPTKDGMPVVSVSAGLTSFKGSYSEKVFKEADIALYHTKTNGRAGFTIFEESLREEE